MVGRSPFAAGWDGSSRLAASAPDEAALSAADASRHSWAKDPSSAAKDAAGSSFRRFSLPGALRARSGGGGGAAVGSSNRLLARHLSELPGPAYPFPSQQPHHAGELLQSVARPFRRARARVEGYSFLDWLQLFLPCVRWLRTYRVREYLLWDIIAGLSVGFMVVPQGMSYANIAGLPSVYGLYGAFLPVLVYSVFGSSRELAVGPVAVTSLLISSSLKTVVPGSADITNPNNPPPELAAVQAAYNACAIQLSLLVACLYTGVGLLNLGFLTHFLSHSVIGGFTSGAAIIIGTSQLKFLLGFNVPRADRLQEQLALLIHGLPGFVWQEYVMGVSLLTMLLTIKFFGKRSPRLRWLRPLGPISACVLAIVAVVAGGLGERGIKTVGHIPAGLPSPTVGWWAPMPQAGSLAPLAVVVMLVDLLESTSIARALAAKGHYELAANQEIIGLGLANFAGSAFNAYSTTGSFSRSAVNHDSGAKTGLAGCVTGCVVGAVLLLATPLFERLPLNVMGAIVISGVSGLFEYEEAVRLFRVRKLDWAVWMCSFCGTMFAGVEIGLAISIGLALLIVIYESAFPHTALLGRVGRTTIYRNVKQFPDSQVIPGICACRVDAPMYFANVQYIHERLRKYTARASDYSEAAGLPLQYLLLDMSPVTHADTTGAHLLEKLVLELQHKGVRLGLCNPSCAVIDLLERTGLPDLLGRDFIFVRMHDAVQACLAAMIADGQAVRPLSAHESQAVSPRDVAAALAQQRSLGRTRSVLSGAAGRASAASWGGAGPLPAAAAAAHPRRASSERAASPMAAPSPYHAGTATPSGGGGGAGHGAPLCAVARPGSAPGFAGLQAEATGAHGVRGAAGGGGAAAAHSYIRRSLDHAPPLLRLLADDAGPPPPSPRGAAPQLQLQPAPPSPGGGRHAASAGGALPQGWTPALAAAPPGAASPGAGAFHSAPLPAAPPPAFIDGGAGPRALRVRSHTPTSGGGGPLHPVSPRTQLLLDEVFSASNDGEAPGGALGLAVLGGDAHYHVLCSDGGVTTPGGGAPPPPDELQHEPGGGGPGGAGLQPGGAGGGLGAPDADPELGAGAEHERQWGEVRLLLGTPRSARSTRDAEL